MPKVALVGASGFVGTAVRAALESRGAAVIPIRTPRLNTAARTLSTLREELGRPVLALVISALREAIEPCDVVINAAGIAQATGSGGALFGANALFPAALAAAVSSDQRFVHVSSAAVQGRRAVLDESDQREPFSPYSASKALGEEVVRILSPKATLYRPTSVHGAERQVTASLVKVLRSPLASVAAGSNPTPQVLVSNVGDAIAYLALTDEQPPPVVLHPWEGITTCGLFQLLGGRRPVVIPTVVAKTLITAGHRVGRVSGTVAGATRRIEMLWFGQEQSGSWLDGRWNPPLPIDAWKGLV